MRTKAIIIAAVLIIVAVVFVYTYYPITQQPQRIVEIDMVARQWYYDAKLINSTDPNARAITEPTGETSANTTIVVTKGDLVIIHFRTGDVTHGFAIRGYPNVGPYEVDPRQTVIIRFTANQEGTFTFYCAVFCGAGHSEHKGTLVVLP